MAIFLDSANPDDVRRAMALGFVAGITTNPTIIARENRAADELIPELLALCDGLVFHQLRHGTVGEMLAEAEAYARLSDRVGLKIPCTLDGIAVLAKASALAPCAVTAIFSPAQALMACAAGANYIIPYVNRSTRLLGDGPALLRQMSDVIRASGAETEVMAASIKSAEEAVAAVLAGADHLTAPWSVLAALAEHPLSRQAIAEFEEAGAAAPA
jgi:transaldolase